MQSQSHAFTPEERAIFNTLDAEAIRRGHRITDHAEAYRVLRGLADSRPIDLSGRAS